MTVPYSSDFTATWIKQGAAQFPDYSGASLAAFVKVLARWGQGLTLVPIFAQLELTLPLSA